MFFDRPLSNSELRRPSEPSVPAVLEIDKFVNSNLMNALISSSQNPDQADLQLSAGRLGEGPESRSAVASDATVLAMHGTY